jgi:hypothetical protein
MLCAKVCNLVVCVCALCMHVCCGGAAGYPPHDHRFQGLSLAHGDTIFATAQWCNQAELCTTMESRRTVIDTVPPVLAGSFGSSRAVERPPPGAGTTLHFQSRDGATFTVILSFDADSFVHSLEANVETVGAGSDAVVADGCRTGAEVLGSTLGTTWASLPVPAANTNASLSLELELPLATHHNTYYRVVLRGVDAAGNVEVSRTNCVLVDKTLPVVSMVPYNATQVLTVGGGAFLRHTNATSATLDVAATAMNDVSGLRDVSLCCGSSPHTCDISPIPGSLKIAPPLDLEDRSPAVSVDLAAVLVLDSRYDGVQVCCAVSGVWPIYGHSAVTDAAPCVLVDFSPPAPGYVVDGPTPGFGSPFFTGSAVYAQWGGFVDPNGGTIVSYVVALSTSADGRDVASLVSEWVDAGTARSTVFRDVPLVQGVTYYALVTAVDAIGQRGAPAASQGQTYDGTKPVTLTGDVARATQDRVSVGPGYAADTSKGVRFVSAPGYVVLQCPRCVDVTSGVGGGGVMFGALDVEGADGTLGRVSLGSIWSNQPFVLGLQPPMEDSAAYVASCECVNGKHSPFTSIVLEVARELLLLAA